MNSKIDATLSRAGSGFRNRLDIKAPSEESSKSSSSRGFRVEDRVEAGKERLPFQKATALPSDPLSDFFARAKRRLESFLDASREAKEAKRTEARDEDTETAKPTNRDKETKAPSEDEEDRQSSLQALFKKREAEDAYKLKH